MIESQGIDFLRRLNEGSLTVSPSEHLRKTREDISLALEELIEVGARIRPLHLGPKRVGWVRGVHLSERKVLKRWISDEVEFIEHLLQLATTLSLEQIRDLNLIELRALTRVIRAMTDSDLKLYAFVSAFVTTNVSEQLWYSRGTSLTAFQEHWVPLPDGLKIRLAAPSDQARLWATLCNYRIQAKQRLETSTNAVLTIRPLVGKGADALANELKVISRGLITDTLDPWKLGIQRNEDVNLQDGWAHSEDGSIEGIMRELNNMLDHDRHEKVFAKLYAQDTQREVDRMEEIEARIQERGGPGFEEYSVTPMTREQVEERSAVLRGSQERLGPVESESESSPTDRLARYK